MAKDPELLRDVRTIGLRKIFAYQRRKARELGVKKEKPYSDEFEDEEDAVMAQALFESMHTHLPSEPPSAKPNPQPTSSGVQF